ncbi:MAG: hypothetical protein C0514_01935 [Candidatus Puniceispirillum sp.]|nr:hypothetical protein [Candidatus Puniceispirillum sp.]
MTRLTSLGGLASATLHVGAVALVCMSAEVSHQQDGKVPPPAGVRLVFVSPAVQDNPVQELSVSNTAPTLTRPSQESPMRRPVSKKQAPRGETMAQTPEVQTQAAPPQLSGQISQGTQEAQPPKLMFAPKPDYPESAKRQRLEGVATIGLVVSAQGTVEKATLIKSTRAAILDESALLAVSKWRFENKQGRPVQVVVPVRFKIS